jgi:hypothetical protein
MRHVYSISTEIPEQTAFGRSRIRMEDDIKMDNMVSVLTGLQ